MTRATWLLAGGFAFALGLICSVAAAMAESRVIDASAGLLLMLVGAAILRAQLDTTTVTPTKKEDSE